MKTYFALLLVLTFCLPLQMTAQEDRYGTFQELLGKEKGEAIDSLLAHYDRFLAIQLPKVAPEARHRTYMDMLSQPDKYPPMGIRQFISSYSQLEALMQVMELSGLRKELFLKPGEPHTLVPNLMIMTEKWDYDRKLLEQDQFTTVAASQTTDPDMAIYEYATSPFHYYFLKAEQDNRGVFDYVQARVRYGEVSTQLMLSGIKLAFPDETANSWPCKLIIALEGFYKIAFLLEEQ